MAKRILKLWLCERSAEIGDGIPDCIVQKHAAFADSLMQLRADIPRLRLHVESVVAPSFNQSVLIGRVHGK